MPVGDGGTEAERLGFYEAMTEGSFKTDAQGRQLFFPWGALVRGYVVPSNTERARLSKILSRDAGRAYHGPRVGPTGGDPDQVHPELVWVGIERRSVGGT